MERKKCNGSHFKVLQVNTKFTHGEELSSKEASRGRDPTYEAFSISCNDMCDVHLRKPNTLIHDSISVAQSHMALTLIGEVCQGLHPRQTGGGRRSTGSSVCLGGEMFTAVTHCCGKSTLK